MSTSLPPFAALLFEGDLRKALDEKAAELTAGVREALRTQRAILKLGRAAAIAASRKQPTTPSHATSHSSQEAP